MKKLKKTKARVYKTDNPRCGKYEVRKDEHRTKGMENCMKPFNLMRKKDYC